MTDYCTVISMPFTADELCVDNIVCIAGEFLECNQGILSDVEKTYFALLKNDNARIPFLHGRYCVKKAFLTCTKQEINMKDITISNGIFCQPILECSSKYDISIAHTCKLAAAILYNKKYIMGIDIESIDVNQFDSLKAMTNECNDIKYLTICWTLKEALSKALKCGLTVPLELLSVKNLTSNDEIFSCEFLNFPQYRGISLLFNNNVLSIVYPLQLAIDEKKIKFILMKLNDVG